MLSNDKIKIWIGFLSIFILLSGLIIFLTEEEYVTANYTRLGIVLMAMGIINLYVFDKIKID